MHDTSFLTALGIILIFFVLLAFGARYFFIKEVAEWKDGSVVSFYIGSVETQAEIASSPRKKQQGLSGYTSLPQNQGMLFVFGNASSRSFWMYNMNFPLDFVWIRENRVIGTTQNVPIYTDDIITTIHSPEPVDMILEFEAGTINRLNIKEGEFIRFPGVN